MTPKVNPWLIAFIVSIAAFMEVLDTTITNVSLAHISGSLSSSYEETTWVLTSYLVSNGIILPISGWLSSVIGRKQYFMLCIGAFTATSFACGSADSLPMLVLFRLIQGLAGGGLQPTQQAIIIEAFPPEKRAAAFAVTGITMVLAPIIGPTLGGWITDNFSWRWIFYINVPVGVVALLLVKTFVHDEAHHVGRGFKNVDYIGLSLVALGLGSLQIVLDKGQTEDWFASNFIIYFTVICVTSLVTAILWILRSKDPIIDLRLLKDRAFGISCILIFVTGFFLYSSSVILTSLLQREFDYDATLAGLVLSPSGIAVIVLMPLSVKLLNVFQAKYVAAVGFMLCSVGMLLSTFITPQTDYNTFVFIRIMQILGIPFLFIPISTLAFMNIAIEKSNNASAVYSLARNLGGSVGISLIIALVSRRQQIHQVHLSDASSMYDPIIQAKVSELTNLIISHGGDPVTAKAQALGRMYEHMLEQAAFLAYQDAFNVLMLLALVFAACALLLPRAKSAPSSLPVGH